MTEFAVQLIGVERPAIYEERLTTSKSLAKLLAGEVVRLVPTGETHPGWIHVSRVAGLATGWLEERFIDVQLSDLAPPAIDDVNLFARHCVRAEVSMNTGGADGSPAVLAEYLLVLAQIETKLDVANFGEKVSSDPVGPFQISVSRWKEFLSDKSTGSHFDVASRSFPFSQIWGAAHLAQLDMNAFSEIESQRTPPTAPSGPFVPSFLNVFHAWMLGVQAAHAVFVAHQDDALNPDLDTILSPHLSAGALKVLKSNKSALVTDNGAAITVDDFFLRSANRLALEFEIATKLLRNAAPVAMAAQNAARAGTAPWMGWVDGEFNAWKGLKETDSGGAGKS